MNEPRGRQVDSRGAKHTRGHSGRIDCERALDRAQRELLDSRHAADHTGIGHLASRKLRDQSWRVACAVQPLAGEQPDHDDRSLDAVSSFMEEGMLFQ